MESWPPQQDLPTLRNSWRSWNLSSGFMGSHCHLLHFLSGFFSLSARCFVYGQSQSHLLPQPHVAGIRRLQTSLSMSPQSFFPRALSLGCHTQGAAFGPSLTLALWGCMALWFLRIWLSMQEAETTILPEGKFSFLFSLPHFLIPGWTGHNSSI